MEIRKTVIAIIVFLLMNTFFVISYFQLHEKGFLFSNAYIHASKKKRREMNKEPYYRQSGITFLLFGFLHLFYLLGAIVDSIWPIFAVLATLFIIGVYTVVSTLKIETEEKKS